MTVGGVKIAEVICFEVAYDDMVRSSVLGGGGVLVVQTNNATYGFTDQPGEQLAISQLRAVETGRPVMIAATSGISGYIDANGRIVDQTAQFTPAVVTADVTPRTGETLAIKVGAVPEWIMMVLGLLAWAWAAAAGRRRRRLEAAFATAPVPADASAAAVHEAVAEPAEPALVPAAAIAATTAASAGTTSEGDGAVTASSAGAGTVNEAPSEAVSSLPAPASQDIVSNARKAHR
jgi:apolipoprotein N-acyltransferase